MSISIRYRLDDSFLARTFLDKDSAVPNRIYVVPTFSKHFPCTTTKICKRFVNPCLTGKKLPSELRCRCRGVHGMLTELSIIRASF